MATLYVHIPFCERKCHYCSFVVIIRQEHRIDEYLNCLGSEAQAFKGTALESVYIGGGTPSRMMSHQLRRLLEMIQKTFSLHAKLEYTFEFNPEDVTDEKLRLCESFGVNRISLGVQTFNDKFLRALGRNHNAQKAYDAATLIKAREYFNVSLDLMFAFPGQSLKCLDEDLKMLTRLASDHVSVYSLTVERNSLFYARNIMALDNQLQAHYYQHIIACLAQAGWRQYEVSNFAKPNKQSKHNLNYWLGGDYIGLGVGAHSFINGRRYWNVSSFRDYLKKCQTNLSPEVGGEALSINESLVERLLFGLRMNRGVNVRMLEKEMGCALDNTRKECIDRFMQEGLLHKLNGRIMTTQAGLLVLDELCARLV